MESQGICSIPNSPPPPTSTGDRGGLDLSGLRGESTVWMDGGSVVAEAVEKTTRVDCRLGVDGWVRTGRLDWLVWYSGVSKPINENAEEKSPIEITTESKAPPNATKSIPPPHSRRPAQAVCVRWPYSLHVRWRDA